MGSTCVLARARLLLGLRRSTVILCLSFLTSVASGQSGPVRAVVITGQQSAGLPAGMTYSGFSQFQFGENGAVAFLGQAGQTNGIWVAPTPGVLALAASGDAPAPDTPNYRIDPNLAIGGFNGAIVAVNASVYDPTVPFAQRGRGQAAFAGTSTCTCSHVLA